MNIQEAKEQIKQAVSVYLMKDGYGNYRIPLERQRPVFLVGAPGIGKTAIMEQIASELQIGLVAYSMTHHTRQSALGLPVIVHREYQGQSFDVSAYTMSEIISSVYEQMERSGKKEGILFLDEINCVSETLAPSMLQFLQYKTFGTHQIPSGWVVVTAGNPPEFNRSVHEFDVVTLDRLKVMEVEPDYETWKKYAVKKGLHKAILTYLDLKPEDFYQVETSVEGKQYVTARGWEDLSETLVLYEEQGFSADETLFSQYLRHSRICGEFASYYELYCKYRADYQIREILEGRETELVREHAKAAAFDERIAVVGLLLGAVFPQIKAQQETSACLKHLFPLLREMKEDLEDEKAPTYSEQLTVMQQEADRQREKEEASGSAEEEKRHVLQYQHDFAVEILRQYRLMKPIGRAAEFRILQEEYNRRAKEVQTQAENIGRELSEMFRFAETCFGDGNELLVMVTELTVNTASAAFIAEYGCDAYYRYDHKFMLHERGERLSMAVQRSMKTAGRDKQR